MFDFAQDRELAEHSDPEDPGRFGSHNDSDWEPDFAENPPSDHESEQGADEDSDEAMDVELDVVVPQQQVQNNDQASPDGIGLIVNAWQGQCNQDDVLRMYRSSFGVTTAISTGDDSVLKTICDVTRGDMITCGRGTVINSVARSLIMDIADERLFVKLRAQNGRAQYFSTVDTGYQMVNYMMRGPSPNVDYVI